MKRSPFLALLPTVLLLGVCAGCGESDPIMDPRDSSTRFDANQDGTAADVITEDASELPICESPPLEGADCLGDQRCQTAGSPCGSIWSCRVGVWSSQVVCPPRQECPASAPEEDEPCRLDNPPAGPLRCIFVDGCPAMEVAVAVCTGESWTRLPPEPCPGE